MGDAEEPITSIDAWPSAVVADMGLLLERVGAFAQEMVRSDGAVVPVGAGQSLAGEFEPFGVDPTQFASMNEAFAFLVESIVASRASWRASCCVVAVTADDGSDALRFFVEHADGFGACVVLPFEYTTPASKVVFHDLTWVEVPPLVWA